MKILYAEDDIIVRELLSMQIEATLNLKVVTAASGNEAIECLKSDTEISLVISDYNMPDGNGDIIYKFMVDNDRKIPFFLFSSVVAEEIKELKNLLKDNSHNYHFVKPVEFEVVIRKIEEVLINLREELINYCKIKIMHFLKFNTINCDVYLKLSENKFVKVISKDALYSTEIVHKYATKSTEYLYILKEDFKNFYSNFSKSLTYSLEHENDVLEKSVDLQLTGIAAVYEMVHILGINSEVVELVNGVYKSTLAVLNNNKNLSKILNGIIKNYNYLYEHSLLTSYIASAIANTMDWITESTVQKLMISSLLHDLSLEKIAGKIDINKTIDVENFLADKQIDHRIKKIFLEHPYDTSMIVKNSYLLAPDIDWIILQHHELPDGSGFPHKMDSQKIPPISCLFIIAETFSRRIYGKTIDKNLINEQIDFFNKNYNSGNFKKPLSGLSKSFHVL
ncbi:MAG: response regulator [Oligoflexia bacterium]|nr:response regulator [Oligoflexia bacterium]